MQRRKTREMCHFSSCPPPLNPPLPHPTQPDPECSPLSLSPSLTPDPPSLVPAPRGLTGRLLARGSAAVPVPEPVQQFARVAAVALLPDDLLQRLRFVLVDPEQRLATRGSLPGGGAAAARREWCKTAASGTAHTSHHVHTHIQRTHSCWL